MASIVTDNPAYQEISDKRTLVEYLESGCKPASDWRLGTEHEKFGFTRDDMRPLKYDGPRGIGVILEGLQQFGWQPTHEHGKLIALTMNDGCSVTLEPGGQLELSGALRDNLHETCLEVGQHLKQVKAVCEPLDVGFLGMGFQPKWGREDIEWMPKGRYKIMSNYMPKVGTLGVDMMKRTCTVQVNLDFSSETDMVKKLRVSLALQPVATALFANSPFVDGKPSGFQSFRSHIWSDTDPNRTGMLPFTFETGMGFERYVDYMLDVPMYFVYRNGEYLDAAGLSFRQFLDGKLALLPGQRPTLKDWEDHLTTVFPEVRLKRYLEMRGADGGPWRNLCALPALWAGIFYHGESLDAAWDIVKDWTAEERQVLRDAVPREGLSASIRGRTVQDIAKQMLELANLGLNARGKLNAAGDNETGFLEPLTEIAVSGITPAERKLRMFNNGWNGSVDPAFRECAY